MPSTCPADSREASARALGICKAAPTQFGALEVCRAESLPLVQADVDGRHCPVDASAASSMGSSSSGSSSSASSSAACAASATTACFVAVMLSNAVSRARTRSSRRSGWKSDSSMRWSCRCTIVVAEDLRQTVEVLVTVLLQQGNDVVVQDLGEAVHVRDGRAPRHQVGVADLEVASVAADVLHHAAVHRVPIQLQPATRVPANLDGLLAERQALAELRPRDHHQVRTHTSNTLRTLGVPPYEHAPLHRIPFAEVAYPVRAAARIGLLEVACPAFGHVARHGTLLWPLGVEPLPAWRICAGRGVGLQIPEQWREPRGTLVGVGLEHVRQRAHERGVGVTSERRAEVEREPAVRQCLRLDTGEQRDRRRADRVYVAARQCAALKLFGGHVAERADNSTAPFKLERVAHRAEVDECVRAVGTPYDVARFDVAMNDGRCASVQVVEGVRCFTQKARDVVRRKRDAALA